MAQLDITSTFRWEGKNGALVVVGGEVDTTGSIPRYQLPSGNMDLLGFWNASTNTPYLYNSAGTSGDVYKCNYAGTVDLGAGPITFSSGDLVYYDGFVWGKISSNAVSSIYAINNYSFTATAGQTVYTFSYVPNQLSVYYNGSKLSKNQYDASGGGFITLNFSPIAGDIITVDAYVNTLASNITGGGVNGAITKWIGTNVLTNAIAGTDYVLPAALNAYVPTFRQLTINGVSYDLTADRSWSINSMVYPSAGIAVSTGSAWGASIVDNSTNWNTAYTNRITSLTTTGTSGFATLSGNVLNIPNYSLNLTGYVPYTGATSDLNLGTNNIYANAFFGGFLNITASGTQVVLTVLSAPEILVSGSGGQTIKLPNATTLPNGATYSFNNNQSSGAILVNNNSNTLVVSIPSGGYAEVILLDNSIAAGSWDRHFQAPANVSWSTNTLDYAGSITSATWNGTTIAINRGGTGATTAAGALSNLGGIGLTSLSASAPLSYNNTTGAFSISQATTSTNGYLNSTDWNTFNNKQGALTLTTTGTSGAATLIGNTLNIPQYQSVLTNPITGTGTSGQVAYFNGTNSITSNAAFAFTPTSQLLVNNSVTAASAIARGTNLTPTLVAAANSDVLVGLDINPTFTNGAFTGVRNIGLRTNAPIVVNNSGTTVETMIFNSIGSTNNTTYTSYNVSGVNKFQVGYTENAGSRYFIYNSASSGTDAIHIWSATGNVGINQINTDAGYKLDVNGTARVQSTLISGGGTPLALTGESYSFQNVVASGQGASVFGTNSSSNTSSVNIISGNNIWQLSNRSTIASANNRFGIYNVSFTGTTPTYTSELLTIQTNGNVGINQSTDAGYKLDVNGTARVQGNVTITGVISAGDTITSGNGTVNNVLSYGTPFGIVGTASNHDLEIRTNNVVKVRITTGGSVGIATTAPNASSILDIVSTTKGFLPPRGTNAQRTAITSPAVGLIFYCTDSVEGLYIYTSSGWKSLTMV